jgi:hypothetical protein
VRKEGSPAVAEGLEGAPEAQGQLIQKLREVRLGSNDEDETLSMGRGGGGRRTE